MCEQFVSASELASKVFITIQFLCDGIKGFLETAPVIFIGLLRLEKRSTEKKTPWERLPKGDSCRDIFESLHLLRY